MLLYIDGNDKYNELQHCISSAWNSGVTSTNENFIMMNEHLVSFTEALPNHGL